MDLSMISLLLWIPFGFVLLIAGMIFISAGYKKGVFTAIFSIFATVFAALASLFLAGVAGGILGNILSGKILDAVDLGRWSSAFSSVLSGMIKGVVSVLLFGILFFLLTMIFKLVMYLCGGRLVKKECGWSRAGGVIVRVLDTVLYTLLLLLPLYGTLGVYAPVAVTAVEMLMTQEDQDAQEPASAPQSELVSFLQSLAEHPLVSAATTKPMTAVYGQLSSFDVNDTEVSPVELMQTTKTLSEKIKLIMEKDNPDLEKDLADLTEFVEDSVLEAEWSYAMCMGIFDEVDRYMREEIEKTPRDEQNEEYVETVTKVLDSIAEIDRAEYKKLGKEGISFVKEYLNALAKSELSLKDELTDAFFYENGLFLALGEVLNASERMAEFRTLYYTSAAQSFFGSGAKADLFLANYQDQVYRNREVMEADGRILAHLLFLDDECEGRDLFKAHPLFGEAAFERAESYRPS